MENLDNTILIRGNHEDLLEELLQDLDAYRSIKVLEHSHHWSNGTVDTVMQLTDRTPETLLSDTKALREAMQETTLMREILPRMKDYYETEHYIFVHGWIPTELLLFGTSKIKIYAEKWRTAPKDYWRQARWENGMKDAFEGLTVPGKTVVCGHFHTSFGHTWIENKGTEFGPDADFSPYLSKGIIAIDACTAFSKKVNCIVLED